MVHDVPLPFMNGSIADEEELTSFMLIDTDAPRRLVPPVRPSTPPITNRVFPGPPVANTGRGKKKTKASTLIAALNIGGLGNPNPWHPKHKWYHINQLVKEEKVGILVVGEAHMGAARHANIQNLFGRRLEIVFGGFIRYPRGNWKGHIWDSFHRSS
jgi:hypothetical protein